MHLSPNSWRKLTLIPTLLALPLALQACNGSTGLVRAKLDSPAIGALAEKVEKSCDGIPRQLPSKELTQAEVENGWRRDRVDSARCADASLSYVGIVNGRDKALTGKEKK